MFTLFKKKKPLFDDETTEWLFNTFKWALESLNSDFFHNHTQLITPTPDFFPAPMINELKFIKSALGSSLG